MSHLDSKLEIKGVRLSLDHLELISEWMLDRGLSLTFSTTRIDNEFHHFNAIDSLIDSQGTSTKCVVLRGKNLNSDLRILVKIQYCIIEYTNIDSDLIDKIGTLLKKTVPRLFKVIPFNWFFLLTNLILLFGIFGYFSFDNSRQFLLNYIGYPSIIIALTVYYNNKVNKINLTRLHQRTSFWSRNKENIYTSLLLALVLVPIISALHDYLWPLVKGYFAEII